MPVFPHGGKEGPPVKLGPCHHCEKEAWYICADCGSHICDDHASNRGFTIICDDRVDTKNPKCSELRRARIVRDTRLKRFKRGFEGA